MRAGTLDRTISIEAYAQTGADPDGTATEGWLPVATVRAQLVQASTDEYLRGYGEGANAVLVFRIYWRDDLTTDHRVTYQGRHLNIREIKEIGRRDGLELRCEEVRNAGN